MLEKLRRFSALDGPAQKLFLQSLALLPLVSLSLRWSGFRATQTALQRIIRNPLPQKNPDHVSRPQKKFFDLRFFLLHVDFGLDARSEE